MCDLPACVLLRRCDSQGEQPEGDRGRTHHEQPGTCVVCSPLVLLAPLRGHTPSLRICGRELAAGLASDNLPFALQTQLTVGLQLSSDPSATCFVRVSSTFFLPSPSRDAGGVCGQPPQLDGAPRPAAACCARAVGAPGCTPQGRGVLLRWVLGGF